MNLSQLPEIATREVKKRRRELSIVLGLILAFLLLTWFEFKLLDFSQQLPLVHSVFFFGLVNFNIVILLLLSFLIFRNVVKVFVERQGKVIGSSLKAKLTAAFLAFSCIPTALMFLVSVFYINNSFEKWFSVKVSGVLKNSLEVNQEYIFSAKKKNYHFAKQIALALQHSQGQRQIAQQLEHFRDLFRLDAVEYYQDVFTERQMVIGKDESIPEVPPVSLEFLRKGLNQDLEGSTIHQFGQGNLIRVIVPVGKRGQQGAVVVSSFIPFSLMAKMDDISAAHEEFRNLNPLQYPLKSIYLSILILMTLVILLAATWFGFYLARELSVPLEVLGLATLRVSKGDYQPVVLGTGSQEMNRLIGNFNQMTENLARSKREVLEANHHLTETLERLDEHSRYIHVVLSNVTTGVISVDQNGVITTINRHAGDLLQIDPEKYVQHPVRSVLNQDYLNMFKEMVRTMREQGLISLQKEVRIEVRGKPLPLQMNLSLLSDDRDNDLGMVLVFDDLTMLQNAQRAAAWTEVARRIAHEIKNPLTPIKLSAQRLEKRFGAQIKDPIFTNSVQMIVRQTDALKSLVNEFSNFARLPQTRPVAASLNAVADEAMSVYTSAHREINFVVEADASLPKFLFDPEQLRRALINLLDNAVAAVRERARPRILLRTQYDNLLKIVRVVVADNGVGIPETHQAHVFEPYYSTKESGSGLGLAIVKRIVEDHHGFVRALPNEAGGTKMIFELPVIENEAITWRAEGESQWIERS